MDANSLIMINGGLCKNVLNMIVSVFCNYVEISFGVCWVMIFRNTSFYSHGFWVDLAFLLFDCDVAFCFRAIWGVSKKQDLQNW